MKLLLFSDVHCDADACRRLVDLASASDVVIGAGDFARQRRGLEPVIDILRAITCPAVLVPGNGESAEELRTACSAWPSATVLHGSGTTIGGVPFFGIGGGIPVTPFGAWSYDFTEEQAAGLLADCPPGCGTHLPTEPSTPTTTRSTTAARPCAPSSRIGRRASSCVDTSTPAGSSRTESEARR
jgi:hypothetical protein